MSWDIDTARYPPAAWETPEDLKNYIDEAMRLGSAMCQWTSGGKIRHIPSSEWMPPLEKHDGFTVGDFVRKESGYDWPGVIRSFTVVSTGAVTAAVENRLSPGTTHVFPTKALAMEDRTDAEIIEQVRERFLRST